MALTKAKKTEVIDDVAGLLGRSKMTVVVKYEGTSVKALQELRKAAKENGTTIKVIKNRLVKQALKQTDNLKALDSKPFEGMLMYAFNETDEVAPAQAINSFARQYPSLVFIGAITGEGLYLEADQVKALALLPNKPQLIAGLINTLNSPLNNLTSSLNANLSGLIKALELKAI